MIYQYQWKDHVEFVPANGILEADKLAQEQGINPKESCSPGISLRFRDLSKLSVHVVEKENVKKVDSGKTVLNLTKFFYNSTMVWKDVGWFPDLESAKDVIRKYGVHDLFIYSGNDRYLPLVKII